MPPPADHCSAASACSTPALPSLDGSTSGCARATSSAAECCASDSPEPSCSTTCGHCEAGTVGEMKLLPTPNATLANYEEDPESWRARQATLKAKGINGNGAGLPLAIAVRELSPSTSSPAVFPAAASPALASARGSATPRLFCGTRCGESFARFDLVTYSSRTSQPYSAWLRPQESLLDPSGEPWSGTWPRSAMTQSGTCFPLLPSAPHTSVSGCSALLPSPMARTQSGTEVSGEGRTGGPMLQEAVLGLLPTPHGMPKEGQARRPGPTGNELGRALTGATTSPPSSDGKPSTGLRLNPSFVGWMMATPSCGACGREWTDPDCPHSATEFTSMSRSSSGSPSCTTMSTGRGDEPDE